MVQVVIRMQYFLCICTTWDCACGCATPFCCRLWHCGIVDDCLGVQLQARLLASFSCAPLPSLLSSLAIGSKIRSFPRAALLHTQITSGCFGLYCAAHSCDLPMQGDGAGVGKGRQIAAVLKEAFRKHNGSDMRATWISVRSKG